MMLYCRVEVVLPVDKQRSGIRAVVLSIVLEHYMGRRCYKM